MTKAELEAAYDKVKLQYEDAVSLTDRARGLEKEAFETLLDLAKKLDAAEEQDE
jgi:hypothetical protein